jgi:endonuclease/exonuclease/phosphatase family metal-dependent hydrolase
LKNITKKILFQLNILAAIGIILAYASNYITPAVIWPIAFFGLAYPYLLIVNLFFLLFWIWRRKKYAFLSLLVILIGFGHIGRYVQIQMPKDIISNDSTQIKIFTYNVQIFNNYKLSGEKIGRDSIIRFANSKEPDIICFQEFVTQSQVEGETEAHTDELLEQTPFKHIFYTLATSSSKRQFGIATYSKYPIVRKGSINFDKSYNSCIYSDMLIHGDTIRLYNVHLQSISLKKNYSLMDSLVYINAKRMDEVKDISGRLKQGFIRRALQVDAVKNHIESSPYPVIVCGDFNDTPVSYSYKQLLGDKYDSFCEVGSGLGKTYRGNLPSYRIDYVFHDENFSAISYSTPKVLLSDHFPVITTLKVQRRP